MMRILVTDGMDQQAVSQLRANGHEVVEQFYEPDQLGAALREFDAVIIRSATKIRAPHIEQAKGSRLKLIIRAGVGIDNIDVADAEAAGIAVRNTPGASSAAVAELALAHMFSCARYVSIAGHTMREGKWEKKAYSKGVEICGKTLGIWGYGRIGMALARMAHGLGMTVLVNNRSGKTAGPDDPAKWVPVDELLARADFISLNMPSIEAKPLINRESIAKMKDGVILINTSRGSNIDEDALLDALNSGKVRAAGLDVYAEEPTKNEALYQHPAVSCTPHIGAGTREAQGRIGMEIVEIIESFG